jgi:hypothetical protein
MARLALGLVLAASLGTAGCGDDHKVPTSPTPGFDSLSGTWTGTVSGATAGVGRLVVVMDETALPGLGSVLSGSWTVSFANQAGNDSGTLKGSVSNGQAAIDLSPGSRPSCQPPPPPFDPPPAGSWSLLVTTSPRLLRGSSLYFTCTTSLPGSVELSR